MKISIQYIAALGFILASCHKKTIPVIPERSSSGPAISKNIYPPVASVPADTFQGRRLYTAKCGRCHGLYDPKEFNADRWDMILPTMLPRVKLSPEQEFHLRAFVLTVASK